MKKQVNPIEKVKKNSKFINIKELRFKLILYICSVNYDIMI